MRGFKSVDSKPERVQGADEDLIRRARNLAGRGVHAYARTLKQTSPNARRYLLSVVLQNVGMGVLGTMFALYVRAAGMRVSVVGNVEGALALASGVMCLFIPPLVAVVGYRVLLVSAALAYGVARLGQAFGMHAASFVALGLLFGVGDGILRSVGVAFLSENSAARDRTLLFTVDFFARVAAMVVGAGIGGLLPTVLGIWLPELMGFRWTMIVAGALLLLSVVPVIGVRELRRRSGRPWATYVNAISRFRSWGRLVRLAVPEAIISFGAGVIMPFVPLFLKVNMGASIAQIGLIQGVASVIMAVATLSTPLLVRRFGLVGTVVLTEIASLPFLLTIPLATSLPAVAVVMWVRSALMNMSWPVYNQLGVEGIPVHDRPLVVGWMSVAWSVAWLGGSVLGGHLNERSYTVPYFVATALYAVGAVATWVLLKDVKNTPATPPVESPMVESAV